MAVHLTSSHLPHAEIMAACIWCYRDGDDIHLGPHTEGMYTGPLMLLTCVCVGKNIGQLRGLVNNMHGLGHYLKQSWGCLT